MLMTTASAGVLPFRAFSSARASRGATCSCRDRFQSELLSVSDIHQPPVSQVACEAMSARSKRDVHQLEKALVAVAIVCVVVEDTLCGSGRDRDGHCVISQAVSKLVKFLNILKYSAYSVYSVYTDLYGDIPIKPCWYAQLFSLCQPPASGLPGFQAGPGSREKPCISLQLLHALSPSQRLVKSSQSNV